MLDPFFAWVESSSFSLWLVESPSLFAFPGILAAHTVGLGLLAGLSAAFDLRLLGVAPGIPPPTFVRLRPVLWFAFWMNLLSGLALLVGYPTKALTNPVFYAKLALIGIAVAILRVQLDAVRDGTVTSGIRRLAVVSLVVWAAAITAGRLLAYTCTRLTVELRCP